MSLSDAYVVVSCDTEPDCPYDSRTEIGLTALAGGGWDERAVASRAKHLGWEVSDGKHYCPDCVEGRGAKPAKKRRN